MWTTGDTGWRSGPCRPTRAGGRWASAVRTGRRDIDRRKQETSMIGTAGVSYGGSSLSPSPSQAVIISIHVCLPQSLVALTAGHGPTPLPPCAGVPSWRFPSPLSARPKSPPPGARSSAAPPARQGPVRRSCGRGRVLVALGGGWRGLAGASRIAGVGGGVAGAVHVEELQCVCACVLARACACVCVRVRACVRALVYAVN